MTNQKKEDPGQKLRDHYKKEREKGLTEKLGDLTKVAEAVPSDLRAQMTLLLSARTLTLVRQMRSVCGLSTQEFIRAAVDEKLDRVLAGNKKTA